MFLTVKVTVPCGTFVFESLNLNSDGEPAVTVTAVAFCLWSSLRLRAAPRRATTLSAVSARNPILNLVMRQNPQVELSLHVSK